MVSKENVVKTRCGAIFR